MRSVVSRGVDERVRAHRQYEEEWARSQSAAEPESDQTRHTAGWRARHAGGVLRQGGGGGEEMKPSLVALEEAIGTIGAETVMTRNATGVAAAMAVDGPPPSEMRRLHGAALLDIYEQNVLLPMVSFPDHNFE